MPEPALDRQAEFPHPLRLPSALRYAALGYRVFPVWSTGIVLPGAKLGICRCPKGAKCENAGKHPATKDGFKDATTDPVQIKQWMNDGKHHNYGIVAAPGVAIIDLDTEDPVATWYELAGADPVLASTFEVDTPNGLHVYLNWPPALGEHPTKLLGSVTRWSDGDGQGYVLGAYSRHASGAYYLPAPGRKLGALAEVSPELISATELLESARKKGSHMSSTEHVDEGGTDTPTQYQPVVGERHPALVSLAARLWSEHRAPEVILAALVDHRSTLPQPEDARKISDRELRDIVDWTREQEQGAQLIDAPELGAIDATLAENIVGTATQVDASSTEVDASHGTSATEGILSVAAKAKAILDDAGSYLAVGGEETEFPAPTKATEVAIDGVLGEVVTFLEPHTAADPYAMLGTLVTFCGAIVNGSARHYGRQQTALYTALVGETNIGRKGTSLTVISDVLDDCHSSWRSLYRGGLGSGEAVVATLARMKSPFAEPRAVFVEEELGRQLQVSARKQNTIDETLRAAYDGRPLFRINAPAEAIVDSYLVATLGHITPKELKVLMDEVDFYTGMANRWLWLPVRGKIGGSPTVPSLRGDIVDDMKAGFVHANKFTGGIGISRSAGDLLGAFAVECRLSVGMVGQLVERHAQLALRIAVVHALMNQASEVSVDHVRWAIALCRRAADGVRWVFPSASGNRKADTLLSWLRDPANGGVASFLVIERLLRGKPEEREDAVKVLVHLGLVSTRVVGTTGRPRREVVLGAPATP